MSASDHPDVIAFPPLILAAHATVGILAHFLVPFPILGSRRAAIAIGAALALTAAGLALWARNAMVSAGTNIRPDQPSLFLVRDGPYRFTRNPMYLGMGLLLVAIGFFCNDWSTVAFVVPLGLTLHFGVVRREERYLEAKFGAPYVTLRREVRRWI